MSGFRMVAAVALAGCAALALLSYLIFLVRRRSGKVRVGRHRRAGLCERLAMAVTLACVLILAGTGLGPTVLQGCTMRGWYLLVHNAAGGGFAVGLAALMVAGGWRHRLDQEGSVRRGGLFWLFGLAGLVSILSILLGMFPILGTDTLADLIELHRYGGLGVVMIAMGLCYQWLASRHSPLRQVKMGDTIKGGAADAGGGNPGNHDLEGDL